MTEFKGRINYGRNIHVEYLVDMKEPGTVIHDESTRVNSLRDSDWSGPTGHCRLGNYPHHLCTSPCVILLSHYSEQLAAATKSSRVETISTAANHQVYGEERNV